MFQSLFRISDTALNVLILKNSMFLKTLAPKNFSILKTLVSFTKRLPFNLHSARKAIDTKNVGFNGTSALQHAGQYIIGMNIQLDFRVVNCNRNAVHLFRFQITLKFSIKNLVILF